MKPHVFAMPMDRDGNCGECGRSCIDDIHVAVGFVASGHGTAASVADGRELLADAERYRWIRDVAKGEADSSEFYPSIRLELPRDIDRQWCEGPIDLDQAIDEAMASSPSAAAGSSFSKGESSGS